MSLIDVVKRVLNDWPSPVAERQEVIVSTHCLYPSNGIVSVCVSGGLTDFRVTDRGGALAEYLSGGGRTYEDLSVLRAAAKPLGLDVTSSGVIFSSTVNLEQLIGTIVLVANASKEAALSLVQKFTPAPKKNFREMLARLIDGERAQGRLLDVSFRRPVVGASTKSHKVDYDISLSGNRRLLLDTVVPESSSINSVLAANLDIRQADLPATIQRIVYDDEDEWKSADLALLGLGATVVPFTRITPILNRLAG